MWCYVQNNEIKEGPMVLPQSWRNISGLPLLGNDGLREIGWLPYNDNKIDVPAGKVAVPSIAIGSTSVEVTYTLRDMTAEEFAAANAPGPVPESVTRAQGRIWLHRAGILPAVTNAINASSDVELQIWWQDAQTWRRNNVHIETLGASFNIYLDAAFREAALIET